MHSGKVGSGRLPGREAVPIPEKDSYAVTKPTHPVELLCCAIATQEGFFVPGTIPALRNNPGDLEYESQTGGRLAPITAADLHIAIFSSLPLGVTALFRQVWLQVAEGQTVRQIINQWDTGDVAYLANVLAWTGLPADTPVLALLPPLQQLNVRIPNVDAV